MSKKTNKTLSKESGGSSSNLWLCIALIALCGCSAQENETPEQGKSVPIGVQASLAGNKEQLDTRVNTGLITAEGAEMGVFLTNQSDYKPVYNKKYTYHSGAWTSTEPIYVDKRTAKLVAYYDPNGKNPFDDRTSTTVSKPEALTVQRFDEDGEQLWYFDNTAQPDVTSSNPGINFKLKPAYARMILSIKRHETNYVSGVCAISKVALSSNGMFAKTGTLDINTAATAGSTEGAYSIDPDIVGIAAGATDLTCDLLLPPQDVNAAGTGLTIALTIDNIVRTINIPVGNFSKNKIEPGNKYTIALLITDAEVKFVNVTNIADWGADTDGGTGSIDMEEE